jgi:hypothetical protein
VIAALLGIPVPVTDIPTANETVDEIPVIVGDLNAVVPVNTSALKVKATAVPVAVAFALRVMLVPSTIEDIVVPVVIPVPTTVIPTESEAVEEMLEIVGLELVVFPVKPLIAASDGTAFLNTHKYPSLNGNNGTARILILENIKVIVTSIVFKKVVFLMIVIFKKFVLKMN